uniref:Hydroxy-delta-5-steroid dehydrogenase, 3 beta- and steroid delta-isomerase n=1 Tax=Eptatretus burgeri TaxID=7764 RepID=A0A8C4QK18_EPTBU
MLTHKDHQGIIVVVTGGCGFLGRRLVQMLCIMIIVIVFIFVFILSASVRVSCVLGDLKDMPVLRDALRDATVVLHAASLVDVWGKYPSTLLHTSNVIGTKNVVEACRLENVPFLIYTSTMEVVGPNTLHHPFIRYVCIVMYCIYSLSPPSKAKELSGGGHLATLALRPTGIYGEDHDILKGLVSSVYRCRGIMLKLAPPEAEHGRVYIGNVAWMHILAAYCLYTKRTGPAAGEVFYCYDDSPYLSYSNFNHELLEAAGIPITPFQVPYLVILIIVWIAEMFSVILRPFKQWTPILNRHTLSMVWTPFTVSTDKAAKLLGYQPRYEWKESRERTSRWLNSIFEITEKDGDKIQI